MPLYKSACQCNPKTQNALDIFLEKTESFGLLNVKTGRRQITRKPASAEICNCYVLWGQKPGATIVNLKVVRMISTGRGITATRLMKNHALSDWKLTSPYTALQNAAAMPYLIIIGWLCEQIVEHERFHNLFTESNCICDGSFTQLWYEQTSYSTRYIAIGHAIQQVDSLTSPCSDGGKTARPKGANTHRYDDYVRDYQWGNITKKTQQ